MKSNKITNSVISTLVACGLLLITSQAALAAKGGKPPPTPAIAIDAVVVDFSAGNIEIIGSGLDTTLDTLTIGGVDVLSDDYTQSSDSLVLDFGPAGATAVQRPGSYSVALNGNAFSVYFSSAIFVDAGATCPCQDTWEHFRYDDNGTYSIGFNGLDPYSVEDTGDLVRLLFTDTDGIETYIWILSSTYSFTTDTGQCDMPIDGNKYEPGAFPKTINAVQHAACTTYLRGFF